MSSLQDGLNGPRTTWDCEEMMHKVQVKGILSAQNGMNIYRGYSTPMCAPRPGESRF